MENETPKMCTSCLFIFLYRTIHRRVDFSYVKNHLPKCFINIHFKDEQSMELLLSKGGDQAKRDKYIKSIEESFRIYWKHLDCYRMTGISSVLNYDSDLNQSDETRLDYDLIEKKCKDSKSKNADEIAQVNLLESESWQESALKICARNLADTKLNRTKVIKKNEINSSKIQSAQAKLSFKITFLVVALLSFFIVIFIYFKYHRPKKPCIKINLRKNNFQRLENSNQIR